MKLFLVDGTPGSLTTAEITNWTGHVLSAHGSDLANLPGPDAQRTGVYLLVEGDETAVGDTRCYIGEADKLWSCRRPLLDDGVGLARAQEARCRLPHPT